MSVAQFICVDDDTRKANSLVHALNETQLIRVLSTMPKAFEDQLEQLDDSAVDGIILDLVLSEKPNAIGEYVRYASNSVAQGLRDRAATDPRRRDVPLALWSTQTKFSSFFNRDRTGHDLYDLRFLKTDVAKDPHGVALQLRSLADGYGLIRRSRGKGRDGLMKLLKYKGQGLDPRIGSRFASKGDLASPPAHEYAAFINDLIAQPYPLVDDLLLSARLGIDRESSSWVRLLAHFEDARYTGPFGEASERWWWDGVIAQLASFEITPRILRGLAADQRVALIKKATGLRSLDAPNPISRHYSTRYWTICDATSKPLDPVDGFICSSTSIEPWHDSRYISLYAATQRLKFKEGLSVAPEEQVRFEEVAGSKSKDAT